MDQFEIPLTEIPSLPVNCTVYPQGKFITGCADIMVGKGKEGTFMRLFYPSRVGDIKSVPFKNWAPWYLGKKYLKGVAQVKAQLVVPIYVSAIQKLIKNYLIPSVWEAPVADGIFPVVVFSHGLLSNRDMSSGICCDIASFGFVVASVEHRDGSASSTLTFTANGEEEWIFHNIAQGSDNGFTLRKKQVAIRAEECSRVLDVLKKVNSGDRLTNELTNSNFDLSGLQGRLDLSCSVIAGHSFGGATALLTLNKDKRFKLGLLLDPWLFPLKDIAEQLARSINNPLIFVLMEKFQTEMNLKYIRHFQNQNSEFYSLKYGTHSHLTDIVALFSKFPPTLQNLIAQCHEPACSHEVLVSIINVVLKKFLFKNLNMHDSYTEACDRFLAKHDSKIGQTLHGGAKKMVGWDLPNL